MTVNCLASCKVDVSSVLLLFFFYLWLLFFIFGIISGTHVWTGVQLRPPCFFWTKKKFSQRNFLHGGPSYWEHLTLVSLAAVFVSSRNALPLLGRCVAWRDENGCDRDKVDTWLIFDQNEVLFYQAFSKYISFANKPACSLCLARSLNAWPAGCMSKGAIMPESKCKQKGLVAEFELKNFHLILTPKRHKNIMHLGKISADILFSFLSQL